MPIRFKCKCGKQMQARDEFAGRRMKCPACANPLVIPGGKSPTVLTEAPTELEEDRLQAAQVQSTESVTQRVSEEEPLSVTAAPTRTTARATSPARSMEPTNVWSTETLEQTITPWTNRELARKQGIRERGRRNWWPFAIFVLLILAVAAVAWKREEIREYVKASYVMPPKEIPPPEPIKIEWTEYSDWEMMPADAKVLTSVRLADLRENLRTKFGDDSPLVARLDQEGKKRFGLSVKYLERITYLVPADAEPKDDGTLPGIYLVKTNHRYNPIWLHEKLAGIRGLFRAEDEIVPEVPENKGASLAPQGANGRDRLQPNQQNPLAENLFFVVQVDPGRRAQAPAQGLDNGEMQPEIITTRLERFKNDPEMAIAFLNNHVYVFGNTDLVDAFIHRVPEPEEDGPARSAITKLKDGSEIVVYANPSTAVKDVIPAQTLPEGVRTIINALTNSESLDVAGTLADQLKMNGNIVYSAADKANDAKQAIEAELGDRRAALVKERAGLREKHTQQREIRIGQQAAGEMVAAATMSAISPLGAVQPMMATARLESLKKLLEGDELPADVQQQMARLDSYISLLENVRLSVDDATLTIETQFDVQRLQALLK